MDGVAQGIEDVSLSADGMRADDAAFAGLVQRHAALMYRVAFALVKNAQDAEDAVQETLLKLYRTGGWRAMQDEKAFLARSVWRVGLSRMGTGEAKAMRHAEDVGEMNLASAALTPEEALLGDDARLVMEGLIGELPEVFRQALVLSAIEGMRSYEVAKVLGVPEGTVRTRVLRAKAELRKRFLAMDVEKEGRR